MKLAIFRAADEDESLSWWSQGGRPFDDISRRDHPSPGGGGREDQE